MHLSLAAVICGLLGAGVVGFRANGKWLRRSRDKQQRQGGTAHGQALEPLTQTVSRCEACWVLENLEAAMRGDGKAMVTMKSMLTAGFGVKQQSRDISDYIKSACTIQDLKEAKSRPGGHHFQSMCAEDDLPSESGTEEEEEEEDESIRCRSRSLAGQGTRPRAIKAHAIRRTASDPHLGG